MTDEPRRPLPVDLAHPSWLVPSDPPPFAVGDRVFIRSRNITGSLVVERILGVEPHAVRQLLVQTDIGARLWFRPEEVERLIDPERRPVLTVAQRVGRARLRLVASGGERCGS